MTTWPIDENDIIFSTTDPEDRDVFLVDYTWQKVKTKHPEVRGIQEIKSTIQKPNYITEDTQRNSLAYTKISTIGLYFNVYAKRTDSHNRLRVASAYLQRRTPSGDVIWVKRT